MAARRPSCRRRSPAASASLQRRRSRRCRRRLRWSRLLRESSRRGALGQARQGRVLARALARGALVRVLVRVPARRVPVQVRVLGSAGSPSASSAGTGRCCRAPRRRAPARTRLDSRSPQSARTGPSAGTLAMPASCRPRWQGARASRRRHRWQ